MLHRKLTQIAIVGAGSAGLTCAENLLNCSRNTRVDVYDKSPVPFGLMRYGVAPDHRHLTKYIDRLQEALTRAAFSHQFGFFGNVNVGRELSLGELRDAYHIVVLAYGAEHERALQLPVAGGGEYPATNQNVLKARDFVGWYNGVPGARKRLASRLDLQNVSTALVVGHGNVAIDVARMLLLPAAALEKTDVADYALEQLCGSPKRRRVIMVGRRGPLQVQFSASPLRELFELRDLYGQGAFTLEPADAKQIRALVPYVESFPRARRRITELLLKYVGRVASDADEESTWTLKFLRTPVSMEVDDRTRLPSGVTLQPMRLSDTLSESASAAAALDEPLERVACELIVSCTGNESVDIGRGSVPFDPKTKSVVIDASGQCPDEQGLFAAGWCTQVHAGGIPTSQLIARKVAESVLRVVDENATEIDGAGEKAGSADAIAELLKARDVRYVSWPEWLEVDAVERERAAQRGKGKVRVKITDVDEIFDILRVRL